MSTLMLVAPLSIVALLILLVSEGKLLSHRDRETLRRFKIILYLDIEGYLATDGLT